MRPDPEVVNPRKIEHNGVEPRGQKKVRDRIIPGDDKESGQRIEKGKQDSAGNEKTNIEIKAVGCRDHNQAFHKSQNGQGDQLGTQVLRGSQGRHDKRFQNAFGLLEAETAPQ